MVKKSSMETLEIIKIGHSEDDTCHAIASKTGSFKSNFYYEGVTFKLIEMKRKVNAKRVLWLFLSSFRCLRSKSWTKPLD